MANSSWKHYIAAHNYDGTIKDALISLDECEMLDFNADDYFPPGYGSAEYQGTVEILGGDTLPSYLVSG